jgi:SET domain-containing protein
MEQQVRLAEFDTPDGRGKGVLVLEPVRKGTLVLSYEGELLKGEKAIVAREESYGDNVPNYVFAFNYGSAKYAIDATHSTHISRLINHSRKRANLVPRRVRGKAELAFYATRDIVAGEELLF